MLAEGRIAAEIVAQDQGVGEQSDQALALDLVAVGDQRSGRDILVSGVAEQQALERREQGHERRDALVLAQRAQVGRQGFGEFEIVTGTVTAPDLRPRPVGSQRQRGDAVELRPPVIELLLGRRRLRPALLPERKVAILEAGRGQRGRVPLARGGILGGELFPEQPLRPAIGDEVMDVDHQRMAGLVEREQRDLQRRLVRKIKRILRELERLAPDDRGPLVCGAGLSLIRSNRGGD